MPDGVRAAFLRCMYLVYGCGAYRLRGTLFSRDASAVEPMELLLELCEGGNCFDDPSYMGPILDKTIRRWLHSPTRDYRDSVTVFGH